VISQGYPGIFADFIPVGPVPENFIL
jgi:hypothetical protein